jgi:hypothetical protein
MHPLTGGFKSIDHHHLLLLLLLLLLPPLRSMLSVQSCAITAHARLQPAIDHWHPSPQFAQTRIPAGHTASKLNPARNQRCAMQIME